MNSYNPILGKDRPNKNNKLGVRNVYYYEKDKLYRVQKSINGQHLHIKAFTDFREAKDFAEKMNTFDLRKPEQLNEFLEWAKNYN